MTNDTSFKSSCALLEESAKKFKINFFFLQKLVISFDRLYAKNLKKSLCKTCAICFLMSLWAFQKAKNYQNLKTENGSKQRFRLLHEKTVIQAVCLRTQAVSIKARF